MIDTIHIWLPMDVAVQINMPENTIAKIDNTGAVYQEIGTAGFIHVKRSKFGAMILCSLPKVLYGDNIWQLSPDEILEAIGRIESILDVSIMQGVIFRIDLFLNLKVSKPPKTYFRYLLHKPKSSRLECGKTSLYYRNNNKTSVLYDKIREIKDMGRKVPEAFKDAHIMRFECRYMGRKGVRQLNNGDLLMVCNLFECAILSHFASHILNEYMSIPKKGRTTLSHKEIIHKHEMMTMLAGVGLKNIGVNEMLEMINHAVMINPDISPVAVSRRRKDIKLLAGYDKKPCYDIEELSSLIDLELLKYLND